MREGFDNEVVTAVLGRGGWSGDVGVGITQRVNFIVPEIKMTEVDKTSYKLNIGLFFFFSLLQGQCKQATHTYTHTHYSQNIV